MSKTSKKELLAQFVTFLAAIPDDEKTEAAAPAVCEHVSKPTMLTIKECAELTNISEYSIRKFALQEKIKSIRVGEGVRGKILINRDSLIDYLNK